PDRAPSRGVVRVHARAPAPPPPPHRDLGAPRGPAPAPRAPPPRPPRAVRRLAADPARGRRPARGRVPLPGLRDGRVAARRAPRRARGDARCGRAGRAARARRLARRVMASMPGTAPVVVDSAGCGAAMKDYGRLLDTPEAHAFASRVRDFSEWVAAQPGELPLRDSGR